MNDGGEVRDPDPDRAVVRIAIAEAGGGVPMKKSTSWQERQVALEVALPASEPELNHSSVFGRLRIGSGVCTELLAIQDIESILVTLVELHAFAGIDLHLASRRQNEGQRPTVALDEAVDVATVTAVRQLLALNLPWLSVAISVVCEKQRASPFGTRPDREPGRQMAEVIGRRCGRCATTGASTTRVFAAVAASTIIAADDGEAGSDDEGESRKRASKHGESSFHSREGC